MNHKVLVFIGSFVVSFIVFAILTQRGYLQDFILWLGTIGLVGNLFLLLFYIVTSFPIPMGTTPLALSAGFLYGLPLGFFTVTVGSVLGAVAAFWTCRKVFADWVTSKLKANPSLVALMTTVEKHSFKICFFVRLSPIPFGIQNSMFAVSKIEFPIYLSATFLGLFPEQLMLVYFGSTAKELKDIFEGKTNFGWVQQVILIVQICICLAILGFLAYTGKKSLQ